MASTPSQNNAFELMTTGEKSGQWGDITNVNLQIIDRATKGVGSIALTSTTYSLDTVDYTVSEGHYAVLVFSGSPGGTCTVTINPNDQQKVFIVRNTSDQTVTITQGSGGDVSIVSGNGAIVYADGAGSGAEVVDVTSTFNFLAPSAIGSTVLAYDSNLQSFVNTFTLPVSDGSSGQVLSTNGSGSLSFISTGTGNGTVTSVDISGGTTGLTASGGPITTSGTITLGGTLDLDNGGTGSTTASGARTALGVAIGSDVLAYDANLQSFVTAFTLPTVDGSSGQVLTTNGSGTLSFTTASGGATDIDGLSDAYADGTSVGLGSGALDNDDGTANYNVALGIQALNASTNSVANVAVGYRAGYNLNIAGGGYNTLLGYQSGYSLTTGQQNVFVGMNAGYSSTTSQYNVFVGWRAGENSTMGLTTVAIGYAAYRNGNNSIDSVYVGGAAGSASSGDYNVGVGYNALAAITGANNTAVGNTAMSVATTALENVVIGQNAGNALTTGAFNTLIGRSSGNNLTTGSNNILIGASATPSSATVSNEITIGDGFQNVVRFPGTTTVSGLPAASTVGAGARSFVTDATATTFASIVSGGGSNDVPVYSDGANWRIG